MLLINNYKKIVSLRSKLIIFIIFGKEVSLGLMKKFHKNLVCKENFAGYVTIQALWHWLSLKKYFQRLYKFLQELWYELCFCIKVQQHFFFKRSFCINYFWKTIEIELWILWILLRKCVMMIFIISQVVWIWILQIY